MPKKNDTTLHSSHGAGSAARLEFDPLMLDKSMPKSAQEGILVLMRAWPVFEMAIRDWLIAVSGMNSEIGVLMIGRMDTRGQIDKLKEIYTHLGDEEQAKWLKKLTKLAEDYTPIRNIIVHSIYLGQRPDPENHKEYQLIFTNHRPVKGRQKSIEALIVRLLDIKRTTNFAGNTAGKIRAALLQQRH